MKQSLIVVVFVCLAIRPVRAENWPQFRGPQFNGSTTETNLPVQLVDDGKRRMVGRSSRW